MGEAERAYWERRRREQEMRDNDPYIGASVNLTQNVLRQTKWFSDPADGSDEALAAALNDTVEGVTVDDHGNRRRLPFETAASSTTATTTPCGDSGRNWVEWVTSSSSSRWPAGTR